MRDSLIDQMNRNRPFRMLAALLLGAALLTSVASPGYANDEEDDEDTFEQKIIKGVLSGLGVQTSANPGIDFRERSPLVLPPSPNLQNLPPPDAGTTVDRNPMWPNDPDQRRRKASAGDKIDRIKAFSEEGRVLSPTELKRGAAPGAGRVTEPQRTPSDHEAGRPLRPSELNYKGGIWNSLLGTTKEESATFTNEPPRTSLTQPPSGYQTPSAAHPYGVAPDKGPGWKPPTWYERAVGTN